MSKNKVYYLDKNDDGEPLENGSYHAADETVDYTLCGLGNIEDAKTVNAKIDCKNCIQLIEFCKLFRKRKDY